MDAIELLVDMKRRREELEQQEKALIVILHEAGVNYQTIGDALGLSRQRIQQIAARNGATVRQYKKKDEKK